MKLNKRSLTVFRWGMLRTTSVYLTPSPSDKEFNEKFRVVHGRLCGESFCIIGCVLSYLQPQKSLSEINVDIKLPSSFVFTEYAPQIFRRLRASFRVSESTYVSSVAEKTPILVTSCRGRSKSRFLQSYDRQFLIKVIARREAMNLRKMLPHYHEFVTRAKMDTLLPQLLGLYRVQCWRGGIFPADHFLLVQTHAAPTAKIAFDLKGTLLHRSAAFRPMMRRVLVLKDLDFIRSGTRIQIGQDAKQRLLQLLERDVEFLVEHGVIDYSLLLSIVATSYAPPPTNRCQLPEKSQNETPNAPFISWRSGASTSQVQTCDEESSSPSEASEEEDPKIGARFCVEHTNREGLAIGLRFSLIDTLTVYGNWNKVARILKQLRYGRRVNTSSAHPELYGRRFLDFLGMNID